MQQATCTEARISTNLGVDWIATFLIGNLSTKGLGSTPSASFVRRERRKTVSVRRDLT
jgi:hypothetical protein